MQKVDTLRIVLVSPGDVKAERDLVTYVADELNGNVAREKGLRLDVWRWETDVSPGFHPEGPQGLVDPILKIEESDVFIGIFWTRFGTPTKDANSGTEHEFRKAFSAWQKQGHPRIMFYFKEEAYLAKGTSELEQWKKVVQFRQGFPFEGLYKTYQSELEFERKVRKDLTLVIQNPFKAPPVSGSPTGGTPVDQQAAERAERAERERITREQARLARERVELDSQAKLKAQQEANVAEEKQASEIMKKSQLPFSPELLSSYSFASKLKALGPRDLDWHERFADSVKRQPVAPTPPSTKQQRDELLAKAPQVTSATGEQQLKIDLADFPNLRLMGTIIQANQHHTTGQRLAAERKWDQAITEFREAIRLRPDFVEAHRDLGNSLGWKYDWDGKAAEAREVIRLRPNDVQGHLQLGQALSWKGDWDGAAVCAQKALSLDPENSEAHFGLGMVLGQKLDWDGKAFRMREALRRKPDYAEAHRELGFALEWKRDWFGAINELREAIRLSPQDAAAHHGVAKAYYETGNREAALDEYRTAYLLDPQNANFRWSYEAMAQERNLLMQMLPVPRFFY